MRMKMIKGEIHFSQILAKGFRKKLLALMMISCLTPTMFSSAEAALKTTKNIQQVDIRVTGTVTDDESGETLPGVTIKVKGRTTGGVATDVQGRFSITVPENAVLEITYLGYLKQEVSVDSRTQINIALETSATNLNEVVVVGYGTILKSDLTGAVSSVKFDNVSETKVVSVSEALQGKLAGVQIITNTGEPGSGMTFNIRGMTSVTGSNQPLIVIDGQPIESSLGTTQAGTALDGGAQIPPADPLATINSNDIASIEILKDASSTAIYGSRGANGVVLITTKSGKTGKDQVVYSSRLDVSMLPRQLDMLNSLEYMQLVNEARVNDGLTPTYSDFQLDSISKTINVNFQDEVYRNALSQDHQLSFSGKGKKYNYLLSANYSDQQSIIKNAGFVKGGLRLNYEREITPKLRIGLRTYLSLADRIFGQQSNWTGILGSSVVMGALSFNPLQSGYNDMGDIDEDFVNNPITVLEHVKDKTSIRTLISNFNADYKISKDLTYQLKAGVNEIYSLRKVYYPTGTFIGNTAPNGSATTADNNNANYLLENILTYKKVFAQKHSLNAVGGFSYQKWQNTSSSVTNLGFPSNTLTYSNQAGASFPGRTYNSDRSRALQSILARFNYAYDKKYLLTLTGRYDGSTRLAPGNKWQLYPSIGLGWNVSNEQFFKDNLTFMSLFKLRTSFGIAGNDNVAIGASQASYALNFYPIGQTIVPTYVVDNFENPNLKWETTRQYNLGADFGFIKDRLSLSIDLYKKYTADLLINLALPGSVGYGSYNTNVGKIMNRGIDIESSYNASIGKVRVDFGANFSIFDNEIINMGDASVVFGRTYFAGGGIVLGQAIQVAKPGNPIASFWGYKTNGIYQNQAEINSDPALANDAAKATIKPGMIKYVDFNGDGQITDADKTIIGNPTADFTYGFNANLSYKRFSASINIFGSYGAELLNLNRWMVGALQVNNPGYNSFQDSYFGRWHGEGTSNLYPKATTSTTRLQQRLPDWMVEDASFLRLQNLTLGYTFSLPKNLRLGDLKIYFTGTNLFTKTKYTGYDPNVNAFGQNSINGGIDLGTLPQSRSFSSGIQLTF